MYVRKLYVASSVPDPPLGQAMHFHHLGDHHQLLVLGDSVAELSVRRFCKNFELSFQIVTKTMAIVYAATALIFDHNHDSNMLWDASHFIKNGVRVIYQKIEISEEKSQFIQEAEQKFNRQNTILFHI